jgi:hypothetical protein
MRTIDFEGLDFKYENPMVSYSIRNGSEGGALSALGMAHLVTDNYSNKPRIVGRHDLLSEEESRKEILEHL